MGMRPRTDPTPAPMGDPQDRGGHGQEGRPSGPAADRDQLEVFFERVERSVPRRFGPPALIRAMVRLVAVPLLLLVLLGIVALVRTDMLGETMARFTTLLFIGKLAAIGGQADFLFWVFVLGTADVLYGLFVILNFDLLKDIPRIGRWLQRTLDHSIELVQKQPALRRVSLLGVAFVISIPVHGTGTITGALMGRILGLGPTRTLGALIIGSYGGVIIVLLGSFAAVSLIAGGAGLLLVALVALLGAAWVVAQHRMDTKDVSPPHGAHAGPGDGSQTTGQAASDPRVDRSADPDDLGARPRERRRLSSG